MNPVFDVPEAAADPIFGIWQQYQRDPNPKKVDLSIGIYHVDNGNIEKLKIVREVERELFEARSAHAEQDSPDYLPISGHEQYCKLSRDLVFGEKSAAVTAGRVVSLQTVGSSAALRHTADYLKRFLPNSSVLVSDPSWGNHRLIFERAGMKVGTYPYYSAERNMLEPDRMIEALRACAPQTIILLQSSSHNPTGMDLDSAAWARVADVVTERDLVPVFDVAYQGLGVGIQEDVEAVRLFEQRGLSFFVAQSFSKTLSMYNRRCGVLHAVAPDPERGKRMLSQLKTDIRANNSNCPIDGALIVSTILGTPKHRGRWEAELDGMRKRLETMREKLVEALSERGLGERFASLLNHRGIFSYSGLSKAEMLALREKFAVYALDSGRLCIASLGSGTVNYVAEAIASVVSDSKRKAA